MRYWAQMYRRNQDGSYTEGVADRSIVQVDGRASLAKQKQWGREWAMKHRFDGFRIVRGDRLESLFHITAAVIPVSND